MIVDPPISLVDYHSSPAISKSKLDAFDVSPRHYWHAYIAGNRKRPTRVMVRGSAFHALMEGGEAFARDFVVLPDGLRNDPRTKAWQEWAAKDGVGEDDDRGILTGFATRTAMSMRDAVMANREARALIELCTPEVTARWLDDETGLTLQARPDGWSSKGCDLTRGLPFCIDYKTTGQARRWLTAALDGRYNRSAAMMQRGFSADRPFDQPPLVFFIVVEDEPPHSVVVYEAEQEFCDSGWHGITDKVGVPLYANGRPIDVGCAALLDRLAECQAKDSWPRDPDSVWPLGLPSWIRKQQEAAS